MRFSGETGFIITELIMVIVIVGILAAIAVPKFINLAGDTYNNNRCAAGRGAINSVLYVTYTKIVLDDPTQVDWMEHATINDLNDSMFASGAIPTCPTSGIYSIENGVCVCSLHGR